MNDDDDDEEEDVEWCLFYRMYFNKFIFIII